jgi:hypothetical protein
VARVMVAQRTVSRSQPPTMMGLGRLVALIVRRPDGTRMSITPQRDHWLAWNRDRRDLVVLVPASGSVSTPSPRDVAAHERFHGKPPASARSMTWPSLRGPRTILGLLESVTYDSTGIRSPSKGRCRWLHQFGDHGERGHSHAQPDEPSPYPDRLLPHLGVDAVGNLWIVRRSGNQFCVDDWIVG